MEVVEISMDTSQEYIVMCRQAKEIQVTKICHAMLPIGQIGIRGNGEYYAEFAGKTVYLPRQDQLQNMIDLTDAAKPLQELSRRFYYWSSENVEDEQDKYLIPPVYRFKSMEQLWLAFVMHTLYKKWWDADKNEWVKV